MKKLTALLLALMLFLLAFSGMASAANASATKPPITVWVGGQKVAFDIPPLVANGSTYVEFKGLFKALGFSVAFDAASKTITGTSASVIMTLNAKTGAATVNGKPAAQKVNLIMQDGRTLVPLRFVGESTGMDVAWNAQKQTITISAKGPTAADVKELQAFLAKMDAFDYASDMDGMLTLFDPQSPLYDAIKQQGNSDDENVVVRPTSKLQSILDFTSESAVIVISQLSTKESGGFYLDNVYTMQFSLVRGQDRQWKIKDIQINKIDYVNTDDAVSREATVPADDKAAILAVIDQETKAANAKDLTAYRAALDPEFEGLDDALQSLKQSFEAYDLKYANDTVRIVDYDGTKAEVYVVETVQRISGKEFPDTRIYEVASFRKTADGKWVDCLDVKLLKSESM